MNQSTSKIVGWGLAGATLAWQLYFSNKSFLIYDSLKNASTRTAAGIVNPIVFKRLTKSWAADKLMPYSEDFYKKIEGIINEPILESKKIYKIFNSIEDENDWSVRQNDTEFQKYMEPISSEKIEGIIAPFGFGIVKTYGNLNTNLFLDASKVFFESKGLKIIENNFDYDSIKDDLNCHVFFCEGVNVENNPFFNYLPLKPTHGETITIKSDDYKFNDIVNKNMFVMNLKGNLFKVGATYNWELKTPLTTPKAKEELIEKLNNISNFDFEVVTQQAGIRPTVKDRRPLIGTHPKNKNLHVFNGLGTKGVMIAPFYSEQLINFVFDDAKLDIDVDIKRYEKYLH